MALSHWQSRSPNIRWSVHVLGLRCARPAYAVPNVRFASTPPRVQDRLGVAVGLLAALEDQVAGRLEGDRLRRSPAPSAGRADRRRSAGRPRPPCAACVSITCVLGGDAVVQPVGDVLAGDAQRGAVLHQADVVDVGHLRAADALVDPAHDVAEDALRVVVELLLDLLGRPVRRGRRPGWSGCRRASRAAARCSSAWRAATSTLW